MTAPVGTPPRHRRPGPDRPSPVRTGSDPGHPLEGSGAPAASPGSRCWRSAGPGLSRRPVSETPPAGSPLRRKERDEMTISVRYEDVVGAVAVLPEVTLTVIGPAAIDQLVATLSGGTFEQRQAATVVFNMLEAYLRESSRGGGS